MIYFLLLYLLPAILNLILYKKVFESIKSTFESEKDAIIGYGIICFMPVINFSAFLYAIFIHVW